MGNNVATGHFVAASHMHNSVGLKKSLQLLMNQNSIQPWSAMDLVERKLCQQKELCRSSPFRFVSVTDGLSHFSKHVGGWLIQLTRERFVQLSIELFHDKSLKCPPEEAKIFYDVFDSIDMYDNATLSIGELAGGLATFFGGTLFERAAAVYNLFDYQSTNEMSKSALADFLKPYVWSLVPESAEILRPILLLHVTDEILGEMSLTSSTGQISCNEFIRWVQRGNLNAAQLDASHTVFVFSRAIAERCAIIIEGFVHVALQEYQENESLRNYGKQTWEAGHDGQNQRFQDVGMYWYAVEPIVSHLSKEMNEAMESFGYPGWRRPKETMGNGPFCCNGDRPAQTVEPVDIPVSSYVKAGDWPTQSVKTVDIANVPQARPEHIDNNGAKYTGEWVGNERHGKGNEVKGNGSSYEGSWKHNKKHGNGIEKWPDGVVYEGEFKHGCKCGKGKSRQADGSTYDGEFKDDEMNGYGTYVWSDGRRFVGEWAQNKMHGSGTYTWPDGRSYEGAYVNDLKEGFGVFKWPDGKQYKGQWKNNKQHGTGIHITREGVTHEGKWVDGKFVSR